MRWIPTHEIVEKNGIVRRGILKSESPTTVVFESEPGAPVEFARSSLRTVRRLQVQE